MADETVKSLATEIQTSVERLVQQFADAGIRKTENDAVTQNEKETLLAYLNREDGTTGNQTGKLTLQRKTRSTLSVPSTGGKSKSVNIEVRKKRTYVDRDALEKAKAEEQVKHEAEEQAKREAEKAKREVEEKKAKREAAEKAKREAAEKEKVKQSKNNQKTAKSNQDSAAYTEKQRREAGAAELKRKAEEEMRRKVEAEAKRVAEEARRMAEENSNRWSSNDEVEDNVDYHTTTSRHAREAEDENDAQEEGRRARNRGGKATRQKKIINILRKLIAKKSERLVVRIKPKVNRKKPVHYSKVLQNRLR